MDFFIILFSKVEKLFFLGKYVNACLLERNSREMSASSFYFENIGKAIACSMLSEFE